MNENPLQSEKFPEILFAALSTWRAFCYVIAAFCAHHWLDYDLIFSKEGGA